MGTPWENAMIGIYKITNTLNKKSYIGQSVNIKNRIHEHFSGCKNAFLCYIDQEIKDVGKDYFTWEVLEECEIKDLSTREKYWIKKEDTFHNGYNRTPGGNGCNTSNPRVIKSSKGTLSDDDIVFIRTCYKEHKSQIVIYRDYYQDKVSLLYFRRIWQGKARVEIMPEVYTPENRNYYSKEACIGDRSNKSAFTEEEIIAIRTRYMTERARDIYEDYKDRLAYQTLQQILWGRDYYHLPVYSKKKKCWINPVTTISGSGE